MTIRRNPITGEPVLFAPERAQRPHAFHEEAGPAPLVEPCPFCPGHEQETPPTIASSGDPWRVRVFANKFPPVAGAEVIVESPRHGDTFAELEDPGAVVAMWRQRLLAHEGTGYAALFRNEGARAGASIAHLHSQLVPLPFIPPRVEQEADAFRRAGACPLCAGIAGGVIGESPGFRWIAPDASRMPWQQWIIPKRHVARIPFLDDAEIAELGTLLRSSARATARVSPSYNWTFMNFDHPAAHFYVDVLPRATTIAGLELGAGTFVQIVDPDDAARRLRD